MSIEKTSQRTGVVLVLICADAEWQAIRGIFPKARLEESPFGNWFSSSVDLRDEPYENVAVIYFHGGWGKISAAASTQYVHDRWSPALLVNLGTCGGIEGRIERGAVVLAEKTLVYDIFEQMGDQEEHIAHYTTEIDLSWLEDDDPPEVRRTVLVSGDRDLLMEDIPILSARYNAVAGDWESGAIAYVASRNRTPCLILRGVSDLVGGVGSEAYGNLDYFTTACKEIMSGLVGQLPYWISKAVQQGILSGDEVS